VGRDLVAMVVACHACEFTAGAATHRGAGRIDQALHSEMAVGKRLSPRFRPCVMSKSNIQNRRHGDRRVRFHTRAQMHRSCEMTDQTIVNIGIQKNESASYDTRTMVYSPRMPVALERLCTSIENATFEGLIANVWPYMVRARRLFSRTPHHETK